MSHWRKFTNNILVSPDMQILEKALSNLGLGINENCKSVKNSFGIAEVDFALTKNNKVISLGFKVIEEGILELNGDFWTTGVVEDTFMEQLSQQYNKELIIDRLSHTSTYSIVNEEVNQDGEIELMVACM